MLHAGIAPEIYKCDLSVCTAVGLLTSGLGRRRRAEGFSEAPGQWCLHRYRLSGAHAFSLFFTL